VVLDVGVGGTMAEVVSTPLIVVAVFAVHVFAETAVVPVVIWILAMPPPPMMLESAVPESLTFPVVPSNVGISPSTLVAGPVTN
jgi:hypothetical protein